MRFLIIAIAALALLGGGAGAYFFYLQPAEASDENAEEALAEVKKKRAPGQFVELDPLILPIVDNNGVNQVVTLVVALEVVDHDTVAQAESLAPKLTSEFLEDIYGVLNEHAKVGGELDIQPLKARLSKIGQDILGKEQVYDVMLQVVQQQPI